MSSPRDYRPNSYNFPSLPFLLAAERVLCPVLGSHVYVGGACVGFYVDDPGAAEIRPTEDVDVVVRIASELERVQLDESLRKAGLANDIEGPIGRWLLNGLKIDVMPSDSEVLGFSNCWYPDALESAIAIPIDDLTIAIPNVCTFIATKIEAFIGRGGNDFIGSSDFEDIARVLDGCSYLGMGASLASIDVRQFVGATLREWRRQR